MPESLFADTVSASKDLICFYRLEDDDFMMFYWFSLFLVSEMWGLSSLFLEHDQNASHIVAADTLYIKTNKRRLFVDDV